MTYDNILYPQNSQSGDPLLVNDTPPIPSKRLPGRPRKPDVMDAAARQRKCRALKKLKAAERRDPNKPLHSDTIDLSALPVWKRKP